MTIDEGPAWGFKGPVHKYCYVTEAYKSVETPEFLFETKMLFLDTNVATNQLVSLLSSSNVSTCTKHHSCYVSSEDTGGGGLIYSETKLLTQYFNLLQCPQ